MLTVYHGSTYRVDQPLAGVCRPNLDFGVGFYLTDLMLKPGAHDSCLQPYRSSC